MSSNNLIVLLRNGGVTRKFNVSLDENETISTLKEKLHEKSGVNIDSMKIVFCGRHLDDQTSLESLRLSPQTNLTVLTRPINLENVQNAGSDRPVKPDHTCAYNSFFVYCKKCDGMRRGKLRAYCSDCKSSSIFFYDEPQGWDDVIGSKKLKIDCKECEFGQTAEIVFKCTDCGNSAIPLTEMKTNIDNSLKCAVCDDRDFEQCVTLDCTHSCCVPCFVSYCEQVHAQQNFIRKTNIGLTVTCPVYLCSGYVKDIHHFYLMGTDAYKRFQKQATQIFVRQQTESQYCPYPECGATFFLSEESSDEAMILCPECSSLFCRYCKNPNSCICQEKILDASLETIQRTSRACPRCRVPTERTGGCAHIHCTQCDRDWCFVCGKDWSDDCQWDHWFQ